MEYEEKINSSPTLPGYGQRMAEDDPRIKRYLWEIAIALVAVLGSVGGAFYAGQSAKSAAIENNVSRRGDLLVSEDATALTTFVQAESDAESTEEQAYTAALDVSAHHQTLQSTILGQDAHWNPQAGYLSLTDFSSGRAYRRAGAPLNVLFNGAVTGCEDAIATSLNINFFEISYLTLHGTFEWFNNQSAKPIASSLDLSAYFQEFVLYRSRLIGRLTSLARQQMQIDTGSRLSFSSCATVPTYTCDSTTRNTTTCHKLTLESLRNQDYDPSDQPA